MTAPPGASKIMASLKAEQKSLNDQRITFIESLRYGYIVLFMSRKMKALIEREQQFYQLMHRVRGYILSN